mmetsp:Transcript_35332/g.67558  ORF Transcript_35332/g.67558 Transcript_35332/m.67558 type:complete len:436 (+) Transcript_35332:464-1771(+)
MSRSFRRSQSTALRVSRAPAAISPSMRRSGTRSPFVTPENSRSSLSRLDDRAAPVAASNAEGEDEDDIPEQIGSVEAWEDVGAVASSSASSSSASSTTDEDEGEDKIRRGEVCEARARRVGVPPSHHPAPEEASLPGQPFSRDTANPDEYSDDEYHAYVHEELEMDFEEYAQVAVRSDLAEHRRMAREYRDRLEMYGHLLERAEAAQARYDSDGECNEVSDMEDEGGGIPDYLEQDDEGDFFSNEMARTEGRYRQPNGQLTDFYGVPCAQFVSSPRQAQGALVNLNSASQHRLTSRDQSMNLDRRASHGRSAPVGFHIPPFTPPFTTEEDAKFKGPLTSDSNARRASGWLHSGLFVSKFLTTKPVEGVKSVLEDKEWVFELLKDLPGVDPEANCIQGVLAVLRGLNIPEKTHALPTNKPMASMFLPQSSNYPQSR